jgi:hypothetical protein
MANENRDVLAADKNAMTKWSADWKNTDFRTEYFDQLDQWHKGGAVGPMPEWMLWPLAVKYRVKQTPPKPEKETPALTH